MLDLILDRLYVIDSDLEMLREDRDDDFDSYCRGYTSYDQWIYHAGLNRNIRQRLLAEKEELLACTSATS